ncbi:sacsin N-terminal ATP-binding-like domain-containing protein [Gordonia crocea]|uniref:Molecular chaperone Hsp90 n=1 Tax=Gordonia crocea TaxID=589162 RepID=A0A7I9UVX1_9ACTN|nr:hypothetical protein [Gordonia crocea]GED96911.1 molecular chaperone Hsp90 [Gordonia crocea]
MTAVPEGTDVFGVAALRRSVLESWRSSPTRLIEDSRAEADLAAVGYRDRLWVELAANAADAATAAGVAGRLAAWRDDHGALHVANTGEPLTAEGIASLLALRVSAKAAHPDAAAGTVGRFGVGFAAVVPVADRVEIRSSSATLVFDRVATERAIAETGVAGADIDTPAPLLRLAWIGETGPSAGFDTEIVLVPREGVDTEQLLDACADQACDRLLELPALAEITVGDATVRAVRGADTVRFEPPASLPGAETVWHEAVWRSGATGPVRWLRPMADPHVGATRVGDDVLRTPTPTDIEISVPARVIAPLPVTPDRRHLMPGVDVGILAPGYLALVQMTASGSRPALVPRGLGRNRVDTRLIEAITDELRDHAWVPAATGDDDLVPVRTLVAADLSDELAACLGPVLSSLAHPDVSGPAQRAALLAVGASEIGLAQIAEAVADADRSPRWWAQLYEALAPLVATAREAEELGALPVPRADGRRHFGARGLVVAAPGLTAPWAPMVHPDAVHPLVERLGAQPVAAGELLAQGGLVDALADAAENGDDEEVLELAEAVLALLAADPDAELGPAAAAELLLPDGDGEPVHVDELLLPGSPLADVLGEDLPFAVVDPALVERYGESALRRAGVGWGFLTVTAQWPTAPDHDLDDEPRWWASLPEPPAEMAAVRDLDLVPDDRWREALSLLAEDPATAPLLADADGYTAWWLREHAVVDQLPLHRYRAPDASGFAGIVDALDHPAAAVLTGVLLGDAVRDSRSAAIVLAGLGDPARPVAPGVAVRAYGEVLAALARGEADADEVMDLLGEPPSGRTLAGTVADDGVVVDAPHYLAVVGDRSAVIGGLPIDPVAARELAGLVDLPITSEALPARVASRGEPTTWETDPTAIRFAAGGSVPLPSGTVVIHDELVVVVGEAEHRVPWWVDTAGTTHLCR